PFMMTHAMKAALRAHGMSEDEIDRMTPTQGYEFLKSNGGWPPEPLNVELARGETSAPTDSPWDENFVPEPHVAEEGISQEDTASPNSDGSEDASGLEPNRGQLKIFAEAMFRHCDPEGVVSWRSFYQNNNKAFRYKPRTPLKGGLEPVVDAAV